MNTLPSVRKPPISKTMGIEIEIILGDVSTVGYGSHYGFFFAGDDGSINRSSGRRWEMNERGFEFVSQPLGHEWMRRELGKVWKLLNNNNPRVNSSCGIHVHVSKKWATPKKAAAIWAFVKGLDNITFEELFGRSPNEYCRASDAGYNSRYHAVNICNSSTVEFRMFASGGEAWCKYCVDCAKYMVDNAYHLNVDAFLAFRDMYGTMDMLNT